ncbi:MAG: CBS domain-containing protein [Saprospiraceae bacterium]
MQVIARQRAKDELCTVIFTAVSAMQAETPIRTIMTRRPETVAPNDRMEVVREIFEKRGFHHIPVLEAGILVGIVSYTDYLRVVREVFSGNPAEAVVNERTLHAMLVQEVMTTDVLCLQETDTVETALRIFKTNHFHSLPVVDSHKKLHGIVTTYDVLKVLENVFVEQRERTSEL